VTDQSKFAKLIREVIEMNIVDIIKSGASAFINSSLSGEKGSGLTIETLINALINLRTGNAENSEGFDFSSIIRNMQASGLRDLTSSWLGDGNNREVSSEQIATIFGSEEITKFASILGISAAEATGGLQDALPHMIDQASKGGSLLDSIAPLSNSLKAMIKLFG